MPEKKLIRHLNYANVMATAAVFMALGGGAYAATGSLLGGTGTIHGCVSKKGGALHIVRSGKKCPHGSASIAFSKQGSTGATGAHGATGATGATGPVGPEGISGETRWGNVLLTPGSKNQIAKVGPFTLSAECESGGEGRYILVSSVGGAWLYGEDGPSPGEMTAGEETFPADDEDTDEALYAWAPSTGTTIQGVLFHFKKTHGSPSACEFQGALTQTS